MNQLSGPAGTLHFDDGGSGGLPVVFVHSFAGSTAHWAAQLKHLRRTRRALAIDLRGHGRSAFPSGNDYSIRSLAGDIAAVVDGLALQRFVLVGHSLGGAVALIYAGMNPERTAGLVLAEAPGKVPEEQARQVMAALEADYENIMAAYWDKLLTGAQPEVRALVKSEREHLSRAASLRLIRAVFGYDPVPALKSYQGPKLAVITPGRDEPYALHRLAPGMPCRVITGTGHWMHMDRPKKFNRILDSFLQNTVGERERAAVGSGHERE